MKNDQHLDLGIDAADIKSHDDYHQVWQRLAPVEVTMIEQNEQCHHALGERFVYRHHYDKPEGICMALHHVLQLYIWRASVGFPSWEEDPSEHRIHCPDKKGTVWAVRRHNSK